MLLNTSVYQANKVAVKGVEPLGVGALKAVFLILRGLYFATKLGWVLFGKIHKMRKLNSCLLTLLFSLSGHAFANLTGEVTRIIDGDTVEVLVNEKPLRVRLSDIDAPESKQPFGQRSRQSLASLVFNHQVVVVDKGIDRYNRTLGTIYTDGNFNVNAEQVRRGFAWAYRYYGKPTNPDMVTLENESKKARKGLWADVNPVEPWKWRKLRAHEE